MHTLLLMLFACGGSEEEAAAPSPAHADPAPIHATPGAVPAGGADADAERTEALTSSQCDEISGGDPPSGPGCLSGVLTCGQTIVGHTLGGGNHFTTQFYDKKQCTPATTDHDSGDERVYRLDIPDGDHKVTVHLDTPCADLDLAAMKWSGDDCPTLDHAVHACDMWPKPRTQPEKVTIVSRQAASWLVVVEGKGEAEGAFSVTVDCKDGLY